MTISASAQMELFPDALSDYLKFSDRLKSYENVAVDWKKGQATQADLNEGLNNLLENNPSVAESDFSKVIEKDPKIWQAYYYRSVCLKQLEKYTNARNDIEHVLKMQPSFYEGHLELGKILQLTYYVKEAEASFDKAIKIAPEKATAYYLKGNIQLLFQKDKKGAATSYRACLKNDSNFHDAQMRLGLLEDKVDATVPYLDIVLRTDSLNRHALLIRSIITYKSNQQQALLDLNKLVRVSPGNLMALYLRGHLLSDREDYTRAFSDFRKVIKDSYADDNTFKGKQTWLDKKIDIQNAGAYAISRLYGFPDDEADKIKKAYCLLVTGSYGECITTLQRTLGSARDPLCLYLSAVAFEHGRAHEDALRFYERALSFDNDILDAHKKRGIYMQELKSWDQSIEDFTEVLRINPEAFIAYKLRGVSYVYKDDFKKAIDDFSKYLKHDNQDKEVTSYRAVAYEKDGQILNAAVDFAFSDSKMTLDFKRIVGLIESILQKGDTLSAMDYLDKLTSRLSHFSEGYALKIKVMIKKNDWDRVSADVKVALAHSRVEAGDDTHSYLLTASGMVAARAKKYDAAMTNFNDAIKFDKENSLAFFERGKMLLDTGKSNKALADLKKAASLGYTDAEVVLREIDR